MKTLVDGTQVTSRSYYYLLDWNDVDGFKYLTQTLKKNKLMELNILEYMQLFSYATKQEIKSM